MKLHLGCGRILLPGWVNVDLEAAPGVVRADLSGRFPWADGSARYVFCEHFFEHLSLEEGARFLAECFRVLRSGGVVRIATPDLGVLVDDYWAEKLDRIDRSVWAPATRAQMLNEAMRLWGHQFLYDADELERSLSAAGFRYVERVDYRTSTHDALVGAEQRPDCGETIIYEGTKP